MVAKQTREVSATQQMAERVRYAISLLSPEQKEGIIDMVKADLKRRVLLKHSPFR